VLTRSWRWLPIPALGVVSHTGLAFRKVRGGRTGQEIAFSVRQVEVAQGDGDVATTLVIQWAETPTAPGAAPKQRLTKSLTIFKQALDNALRDTGKRIRAFTDGPGVLAIDVWAADRDDVRREFMKIYPAENDKAKWKAFERCLLDAVAGR
jgi:hypothetical protein